MNDTGPDAVPPPASSSRDDRTGDRFVPVPEPYLNSMPSVRASDRMESIVSCTELMKQAEHCGCVSKPQLNQTGLLNAAFGLTRPSAAPVERRGASAVEPACAPVLLSTVCCPAVPTW